MAFLLSKTLSLNVELQIGMKWKGESSQEEACINQLWCQTHMYKHPHAHSEVQREDVIVPLRGLILWNHKSNTLWCNYLLALIQKLKSDPAINTLINDLFMKQHELTCFLFFFALCGQMDRNIAPPRDCNPCHFDVKQTNDCYSYIWKNHPQNTNN